MLDYLLLMHGDATRESDGTAWGPARDLEHAREYLDGNPVYEAGGTVEIRELPRD